MTISNSSTNWANNSPMILTIPDPLSAQIKQEAPAPGDDSDKKSSLQHTANKVEDVLTCGYESNQRSSSAVEKQSTQGKKRKARDEEITVQKTKKPKIDHEKMILKTAERLPDQTQGASSHFAWTPIEVKQLICSHVKDWEDLLSLRECSKESRFIADAALIDMLNAKTLTLADLNLLDVNKLINFFDTTLYAKIIYLNFKDCTLNDKDIENIANTFPQLKHLTIDNSSKSTITNDSTKHLEKLAALESFTYVGHKYTAKKLSDFNFLKNLKFLNCLKFSDCPKIRDFSFLAECTHLDTLIIERCPFFDCRVLKNLNHLATLHLIDCYNQQRECVIDTESLKHFNLKHFRISSHVLQNKINFLTEFKDLETLEIASSLTDLSIFDRMNLSKLKSLRIDYNNDNLNLPFLERCENLTDLHIEWSYFFNHNSTLNLNILQSLKNLTNFTLEFNVTLNNGLDLSVFQHLKYLKSLTIIGYNGYEMQNTDALQQCPNLTSLTIKGLSNKNISFITHLNNLKELAMTIHYHNSDSDVDISPLQHLVNLETLTLFFHRDQKNINALQHLHKLKRLNLTLRSDLIKTKFNTSILQNLSDLRELDFYGNIERGDLTPLTKLKKLHILRISPAKFKKLGPQSSFKNLVYNRGVFPRKKKD